MLASAWMRHAVKNEAASITLHRKTVKTLAERCMDQRISYIPSIRERQQTNVGRTANMDEIKPRLAYICGTNLQEMSDPEMYGDCKITPNPEYPTKKWGCSEQCGIAEVEIRFIRWVQEPRM